MVFHGVNAVGSHGGIVGQGLVATIFATIFVPVVFIQGVYKEAVRGLCEACIEAVVAVNISVVHTD